MNIISSLRTKGRNTITWDLFTKEPITQEEAMKFQTEEGYNPCGYSFYSFTCVKHLDSYRSSWWCSQKCE